MNASLVSDRDVWLLQACLRRRPEDVAAAFAAWRPFADPARLRGRELRLMPLLVANLRRAGIDDPRAAWIRGQAKHIWLTGAMRTRRMLGGLDALAGAEIPVVLIKGAALLARWRKEVETRPTGDFDLLIPPHQVRRGLTVLLANGWFGARPDCLTDSDMEQFHALTVDDRAGNALDLHWRAAEAISDPSHAAGVFARAVEREIDRRRVLVAGLTDHLFVLLAHAFHDTVLQRPDWVSETALLFRLGAAEDWDWNLFSRLCRRYRLEYWTQQALSVVAEISQESLPAGLRDIVDGWDRRDLESQKHEVDLRGRVVSSVRDLLVRRRGEVARGRSPVIERCALEPARSISKAQKRHPSAEDFVTVGAKGFNLTRDPGGASFLYGWSVPQVSGRWTDADVAMLALRVPDGRPRDSVLVHLKFVVRDGQELKVTAWAGDKPVTWSFPPELRRRANRALRGRLVAWGDDAVLPLWFRFDGLLAPAQRTLDGVDHRALGLYLRRLMVFRNWPTSVAVSLGVALQTWRVQAASGRRRHRRG